MEGERLTGRGEAVKMVIGTIWPGKAQDSIMLAGLKVFIFCCTHSCSRPWRRPGQMIDSDSSWMGMMSLVKPQSLFLLQALTLLTALKLWTYSLRTVGCLNDPMNACSSSDHLGSQRWSILCQLEPVEDPWEDLLLFFNQQQIPYSGRNS